MLTFVSELIVSKLEFEDTFGSMLTYVIFSLTMKLMLLGFLISSSSRMKFLSVEKEFYNVNKSHELHDEDTSSHMLYD